MDIMDNLFILACVAMSISLASTPLVKNLAVKIGAVDVPRDNRRMHKKPIPTIGGVAIYIGFIIVMLLKKSLVTDAQWGLMFGATIVLIGGVLDDKYDLRPWQKLIFQISAAVCLLVAGVKIEVVTNPFGSEFSSIDLGALYIPVTILWVVGLTNAINFIDGLDGLAAGIALISTLTILIISILENRVEAAYMTAILSGSILGFLPYNFNPASIFMGDTGAQLLGFILAAISIDGTVKSATAIAISVPILALGLPIFDTLFAMVRRKVNGKPMMQGDRGHLHHRLLDMGMSQRKAVIIMYLISAALGGISIIAMIVSSKNSYFLLAVVILIIVSVCWKLGFFKHND
jgi:UDP-GlcNAc:undecaprenyl-phosphate/decaprenyl-phosphate GlcNAc-1-phosphate transferase